MTTRSLPESSFADARKQDCSLTWGWVEGKTAITLSALEERHLPVLVIAPKRVAADVWPVETPKWRPDLSIRIAQGTADERRLALHDQRADIIALGRDNVGDLEHLHRKHRPFRTVVIDELSSFKGRGVRWKAMKKFIRPINPGLTVWGLTGTPTPNGYLDLWPEVFLLDGGRRLGTAFGGYRNRYFTAGRQIANGTIVSWDMRPEAESHIQTLIEDLCISMSAKDKLDLPEVTYNPVVVDLPPAALRAYSHMQQELVADLRDIFGGEIHSAKNAAVMTSKLSQIAAGFVYVDDADLRHNAYTHLHNEKINAVKEIVEGTGDPVLVFYRFQAEAEMLKKAFPDAVNITDKDYRQADWDAGRIPVMLAHPASAGHGLNLQHGSHTIVWTSLPWSSEEWEQGNGRINRQGQEYPVMIHIIFAAGSVDYLIRERLDGKISVQDALLAHLESPI